MVTILNKDRAIVDKLLSEIGTKTDSEKSAVYAKTLELLVDFKRIEVEYQILFSEGLKWKDPEILLAAVQNLEDGVKDLFSNKNKNDRGLSKTTSMFNNMTRGEYHVEATCRGILGDMTLKQATEERLRKTAKRILEEKKSAEQEAKANQTEPEESSFAPKM